MDGAFAFVLHSHLPYVRGAGRWPHGEEWVHEAMLGTYVPLLVALHDLRDEKVPFRIAVGLTPPLLEQLADRSIRSRFVEYAGDQIARAEADAREATSAGLAGRAAVAAAYRDRFAALRAAFSDRFGGDLPAAFASLARSGELEVLRSAATHGYLPLLDDASVEAQLAVGRAATRRILGLDPSGLWLPECAYRPGLEHALARNGVSHVVVDRALIAGRSTATRGLGRDARRSGGGIVTAPAYVAGDADPLRAHFIRSSGVAAFARHVEISGQVWSAATGYPGDASYREFHRKDPRSGHRYWRVSEAGVELGGKAEYEPAEAQRQAALHASHFVEVVRETLAVSGSGLVVAAFDSELFGHWWYEGVDWLARVLRELASAGVPTVTLAGHLQLHPPSDRVALAEGSWGAGNDHSTWMNARTAWMHAEIAAMCDRLRSLAAVPPAEPIRRRAAAQAVRELLLAEASDWPFLITTDQAPEYAAERFRVHAGRFARALELARSGERSDEDELRDLERTDAVFAEASLAHFAPASRGPV